MNPNIYIITKENDPSFEFEKTLLHNNYKKNKKYVFIIKLIHLDFRESTISIDYSNNFNKFKKRANKFLS